jgi:recombinational DNA repair protein RecT
VNHRRNSDPDDEIKYAWASISVVNGPPFVAVWPATFLKKHADKYVPKGDTGRYYQDALIVTNYEAWCQKTMLRRALKFMPLSEVARDVLDAEEYIEADIDPHPTPKFQDGDEQTTEDIRQIAESAPSLSRADNPF